MNSFTILYFYPPYHILFPKQYFFKTAFFVFSANIFSYCLVKFTMSLQETDIEKIQYLLPLVFSVTDHKIQKITFNTVILYFQYSQFIINVFHKSFCSTYVQLSCFEFLKNV